MTVLSGYFHLGADAETREGENGKFANLRIAYNYYDNKAKKRLPQWIKATLGGKPLESLLPYLKKGTAIDAAIEDLHVEEFQRKDGSFGSAQVGRIIAISLAGSARHGAEGAASGGVPEGEGAEAPNEDPPF